MEILIAYAIVGAACIGLCANFFAIFCLDENDRINAEYLEEAKTKLVKYGP